jgi:hypothetical protein
MNQPWLQGRKRGCSEGRARTTAMLQQGMIQQGESERRISSRTQPERNGHVKGLWKQQNWVIDGKVLCIEKGWSADNGNIAGVLVYTT